MLLSAMSDLTVLDLIRKRQFGLGSYELPIQIQQGVQILLVGTYRVGFCHEDAGQRLLRSLEDGVQIRFRY